MNTPKESGENLSPKEGRTAFLGIARAALLQGLVELGKSPEVARNLADNHSFSADNIPDGILSDTMLRALAGAAGSQAVRHYENQSETLRRSIENLSRRNQDKDVLLYAAGSGPLTARELVIDDEEIVNAVMQCQAEFGWPTLADEKNIQYPKEFKNDDKFADALFMQIIDEGLNNFKDFINATPIRKDDLKTVILNGGNLQSAVYGMHPVLHRAYALLPSFMQSLHDAYDALLAAEDTGLMTRGVLSTEDGQVVVEGMHKAFRVLARLLTSTDRQIRHGDSSAALVSDARIELST